MGVSRLHRQHVRARCSQIEAQCLLDCSLYDCNREKFFDGIYLSQQLVQNLSQLPALSR
jgi:hypothetical protein